MQACKLVAVALGAFCALSAPGAMAQDPQGSEWSFTPRVTVGLLDYELVFPKFGLGTIEVAGTKSSIQTAMGGLGVTAVNRRHGVFVDIYGQSSLEIDDDVTNEVDPGPQNFEGTRSDGSIAVGYIVNSNLSVYGGLRFGRTEADGNLGDTSEFEEYGPFVGVAGGFAVGNAGYLRLNLAGAYLEGRIDTSDRSISIDGRAETLGFTYGIAWQGRMTDRLSYSLAFDGMHFDFRNFDGDSVFTPPGASVGQDIQVLGDFEERMFLFRASLSYRFDL